MSNKFGSMFDDDELGAPSPAPPSDEHSKTAIEDLGLLNDEARALIEAQAKAAMETSKKAAKAGLAATLKAGEALAAKAKETKARVQADPASGKRAKVLAISAAVVVVLGVVAWFVFKPDSQDAKPASEAGPMTPVIPAAQAVSVQPEPPALQVVPDVETQAGTVEVQPQVEPTQAEPTEPVPMPMLSPGAFEAQATQPNPPKEEPLPAVKSEPAPVPAPAAKPAVAAKPHAARPRPTKAPQVGEQEQQQIDAIKRFEAQFSGKSP